MKFLILTLALFSALPLAAAPDWVKRVNIPKTGALKKIDPTHLSYKLSWDGRVKAGTLDLTFGKKDPRYPKHFIVQSWGGSTGWASVLYPFQFNYIGFLSAKTYRSIMFIGNEVGKRKDSNYQFTFKKSQVTGTKKSTYKNGKANKTQKRSFKYPRTLDLFGGLLQIRSLKLENNKTYLMPFHPVGKAYLANITVLGRETHMGRKAIKLRVSMKRIQENLELKTYKKLKSATVWLSDDSQRIPLEVRAKVWVGDVRMSLLKQKAL